MFSVSLFWFLWFEPSGYLVKVIEDWKDRRESTTLILATLNFNIS